MSRVFNFSAGPAAIPDAVLARVRDDIPDWNNTGSQATVNHSTATISGSATIELLDADLVPVYSSPLAASANEQSNVGTPGIWLVRVTLTEFSGTANFRVEKM